MQDTLWKESFPPFLRDAMRAIGMDPDTRGAIADLGRASGVPPSTISRMLAGAVQPTVPTLRDIAPVLKIRVVDLLIAAGHLRPDELAESAEAHIDRTPGLTQAQRGEMRGYLARMRERTGYYDRHPQGPGIGDAASESSSERDEEARDETG